MDSISQRLSRQEKQNRTVKNILAVATRLFARNGYERTSTESIATEAGVSQGIIFHYFKTKKNLFWSTVFNEISLPEAEMQEYRQNMAQLTDPVAKIRLFGDRLLRQALYDPELAEIRANRVYSMDLSNEPEILERMEQSIAPLKKIFREGMDHGIFRADIEINVVMLTFIGVFNYNYTIWNIMGRKGDLQQIIRQAYDLFLQGLIK